LTEPNYHITLHLEESLIEEYEMKLEDLKVAAENAAKKKREFEVGVEKFTAYSRHFLESEEYKNICEVFTLIHQKNQGMRVSLNHTGHTLLFHPANNNDVPFFSNVGDASTWLSWEDVARDWFTRVTGEQVSSEISPELFWRKVSEQIESAAYWFRRTNDPEFHKSEIEREYVELAEKQGNEAQKNRKYFSKGLMFVAFFILALILLLIYIK
jgi:hypothetical protein